MTGPWHPQPKVILTCAVTGNLTRPDQTPHLPITAAQISDSCLEATRAGASIVHIHVRDPDTGAPSMALHLYQEVVERIRAQNKALILNLTTGPGGRYVPDAEEPKMFAPGTTLLRPELRVEHIPLLRPEICTLDLNTMNSGSAVVINTPANVQRMAAIITDAEVKPEIELFDSGDIALLNDLVAAGHIASAPLCSIVMGVKYGFQPGIETILYARNLLPAGAQFTAFGIGKAAFPSVALSYLAGGHVRIGLEDTVYLERGKLASSNANLVEKACGIVRDLGGTIATPEEARELLRLI